MKHAEKKLLLRIERKPEVMFGKPVIKGTRLPVELLLEKLAYGHSQETLMKEYPFLKLDDLRAILLYASRIISLEEVVDIE